VDQLADRLAVVDSVGQVEARAGFDEGGEDVAEEGVRAHGLVLGETDGAFADALRSGSQ
jgi:hypothetical protein